MPIYEYACKSCSHQFDALQKMSDDVLVDCPECGKPELRKLLSAPKFRLAGSGWYETDFKTDGKRNLAGDNDKPADSKTKDNGTSDKPNKSDKPEKSKTSDNKVKSDTPAPTAKSTDA